MARRSQGSTSQAAVRPSRTVLAVAVMAAAVSSGWPAEANATSKEDKVFTIGNYPVEARAADAVAAKDKAITEGQQAAFRSLLKRLVPVTSYKRLASLKSTPAAGMVESLAVRSERNSSTEYIASYDFVFSAEPVRRLLDAQGIPYLDRQAPQVTIVPVYRVPPELAAALPKTFAAAAGSDAWLYAWKALDLVNSLTPATIKPLKREIHADSVKALAEGDQAPMRNIASEYQTETVVLAILEPEADLKRLKVVIVGRDAVQPLYLKRIYRLEGADMTYSAELAAVVSHAILEGRWKAINVRGEPAGTGYRGAVATASPAYGRGGEPVATPGSSNPGSVAAGAASGPMTIAIQFNGMGEWQEISRHLSATPEISGLEVLGLSARGARVSLSYPGGTQNLALALAQQGLILENSRGNWVLTRR